MPVTDAAYGNIATSETEISAGKSPDISDTERIVRDYFKDLPVMVQIARCESAFRHQLSDGSILKGKIDSADTGVMQINARYHGDKAGKLGLDLTDIYDNMAYARDLYEREGTTPWSASSACWEPHIAMR